MKDAIIDSIKVLIPGQTPMVITPTTEVTALLTQVCSLLSILYTIYRFYKAGKDKNQTDGKSNEEKGQ